MKNINNKGLTLTELVVSTVLIAIVMLGVAGFSFAIKSIQESTSQSSVLISRTTALMGTIHNKAVKAMGSSYNPGIQTGTLPTGPPVTEWVSFRIDRPNTPDDFTDDQWSIFVYDPVEYTIHTCAQDFAEGPSADGSDDYIPDLSNRCDPDDSIILSSNVVDASFQLVTSELVADPKFYVEIIISSRWSPSEAADPVTNPEFNIQTRISPSSHTWY